MLYIVLGAIFGYLIYFKLIKPAKYWEERHVTHEPSLPLVGNMSGVLRRKKHRMDITTDLYKKYSSERYVGMMEFTRPILLIRDLELIKQITIKSFDHFVDRSPPVTSGTDPLLSKSLIALNGEEWRQMRATLSPAFSSSKMRGIYQLMTKCAENFVGYFRGKEQVAVEMKDILSRFTTDVIATTAFGVNVDSLNEPNNSFFTTSDILNRMGALQLAKVMMLSQFKFLAKFLGVHLFPKDVTDFFLSTIKDNISEREKNGIVRLDMIHLLMEARKGLLKHDSSNENKSEGFAVLEESQVGKSSKQIKLEDDDIAAQSMVFFIAGFETVATTSSFLAYELAINPEVQKKLHEEIDEVNQIYKGKIPYESLLSMKYLDQVICETLRMWTPAFQTNRVCTKDFLIEPKNPNEKRIVIAKGDSILIPVMAIHRDPQYFPEPDRFDPERFNDENKGKIVPGSYIPFGAGPRSCIGSRFALLEIKTLFVHLLSKFDIIALNDTQIPIKISPKKARLLPENGFRLGLKPRNV